MDWSEPLADKDAVHANLMLFKRKAAAGDTRAVTK